MHPANPNHNPNPIQDLTLDRLSLENDQLFNPDNHEPYTASNQDDYESLMDQTAQADQKARLEAKHQRDVRRSLRR